MLSGASLLNTLLSFSMTAFTTERHMGDLEVINVPKDRALLSIDCLVLKA
jgi:hypothetical protein